MTVGFYRAKTNKHADLGALSESVFFTVAPQPQYPLTFQHRSAIVFGSTSTSSWISEVGHLGTAFEGT